MNANPQLIPMHSENRGKIGLLLAQLGTPDEPTARGLRPYLRDFLSDMRVIDYHPLIWQPILRGIILRVRPAKSAKLYARIWTEAGSPLLLYSQRAAKGVQARLGDQVVVKAGMTYGSPNIRDVMAEYEAMGINRILVLPMFPQYSSTTTASIYDAVYRAAAGSRCPMAHGRKRSIPTLRFAPPYYDHPGYIDALVETIQADWDAKGQPQHFVMSFHGIPARYGETGDPYEDQCAVTAQQVAQRLGLDDAQWTLTFQSRFGPEPWLQPYTDETLEHLAESIKRVSVACPGFTADCLETLDEIGNEGAEAFTEAGGERLDLVPCLNDHPRWLDTLAQMAAQEARGWVDLAPRALASTSAAAADSAAGD